MEPMIHRDCGGEVKQNLSVMVETVVGKQWPPTEPSLVPVLECELCHQREFVRMELIEPEREAEYNWFRENNL